MIINFEELEVWKECMDYRMQISVVLKYFPIEEKFRIVDQLI